MNYTDSEILEFQQKDKRIIFESVFSSLCNLYANKDKSYQMIVMEAFKITEKLLETYPMKAISQTIKNRAGGAPF